MKLKSNKGYVGIDISMALLIILVLVPIIAGGIYNINKTKNEIKRKSEAVNMAVNIIETAKGIDLTEFDSEDNSDQKMLEKIKDEPNIINEYPISFPVDETTGKLIVTEDENKSTKITGTVDKTVNKDKSTYKVTISVKDYSKVDTSAQENKIKTVTVKVEYRAGGETENIELSTVLT